MAEKYRVVDARTQTNFSMHPHRFLLWLFLVSITMIFAAFTSAYIVKRADGNWLIFDRPELFYYSSVIIIVSSITMHLAYYAAKKDQIGNIKIFTIITFLLGLVFLYLQVEGFWEMHADGVYVFGTGSNPASSFVFVIAFMHGLHIIGGLVFLLIVLVKAFLYQIHAKSTVTIRMCTTFWHYLDILWLYLFAFMLLYP